MRILIVEDNEPKYREIVEFLGQAGNGDEVVWAKNFVEAVKLLGEHRYIELLILDIFLPMRNGSTPSPTVGLNILEEIVDGGSCQQPNHIVCLSEFCADAQDVRSQVAKHLVHLVDYSPGDSSWVDALTAKLDYIRQRIETVRGEHRTYGCDIGIVTASPDVEMGQVLKIPCDWTKEFCPDNELILYRSDWENPKRSLNVVACEAPGMGMTSACVTAMKLIERERPRYLAMCGILAGTDPKLSLGDVVVGSAFFDYGSGKIVSSKTGGRTFLPDPQQILVDPCLGAILKDWENSQRGMNEIGLLWSGVSKDLVPRLHFGVIASGSAVIQDDSIVEEVKTSCRKTVGLEMEAYAIAQAARHSSKPKPYFLVAKSICDFANSAKNDGAQEMAAFTSARFLHSFFTMETSLPFLDLSK